MKDGPSCALCGQTEVRPWTQVDGWHVVRCLTCGLLFTWPRPDSEELHALYGSGSYYQDRGMGPDSQAAWLDRARAILDVSVPNPRSVVDIGAGQGHFMAALKRFGIDATGIEPTEAGRAAAARLHGITLHAAATPQMHGRHELATLIHSLEHVPDPVATLRDTRLLLRSGGTVFIEVPHARSMDRVRPRWRREILDLPAHLHHFVPATLARVVERAGLRVVTVHRSNPEVVEWLLALRARLQGRACSLQTQDGAGVARAHSDRATGSSGDWRSRILPWLRRHLPGRKLQLIARLER